MNKKLRALLVSTQPGSHRSDGQLERVCTIWRVLCLNGHRTRSCANVGLPNTPHFASHPVAAFSTKALGHLLPPSSTKRQILAVPHDEVDERLHNQTSPDTENAHRNGRSGLDREWHDLCFVLWDVSFLASIKKADNVGQRRAYAQENNLEGDRLNDLSNTRGIYQ